MSKAENPSPARAAVAASSQDATRLALAVLRGKASRYALYGTVIAVCAVILGTLLVAQQIYGEVTLDTIMQAHRENIALQVLDVMPFIFALWGQYASFKMAREAGQMVDSGTRSLRQALEKAQASAQSKTEFFARMSHELRTPINAIMGMSEMLLDEGLARQQERYAAVIRDSAEGLLTIINDVLDFSKIEAGRLELDRVEFNLHECVNNVVALLAHLADQKGLELKVLISDDVPRWVQGDPGRLRQILINLVGNAVKFTERGEVIVSVADWERDNEGLYHVRFEVADTGIGISKTDQAILFQPYRQVSEQGQRRPGTGLGLSISRQLVEAMGGHIGVESEMGRGSRFWFSVRMGATEAVDIARLARRINLRGARVLLCEPPSGARAALVDKLRTMGMEVVVADTGGEALNACHGSTVTQRSFDVALLDMFLPDLSGEELGRQLRAEPLTRDLSLVIMTNAGTRGDARRYADAGFAGYLSRPLPFDDLPELLAAVLAMQALPESQRQQHGLITRHFVKEHRRLRGRVLLVEDSDVNVEVARSMLARMGCEIDVAATGDAAVQAVEQGSYAVVLLDYRLPDADGAQVLVRIRELPAPQGRAPVLIFSAGLTDQDRQLCTVAGADGFLEKPIRPEALRSALRHYLEETDSGSESESAAPGPAAQDLELMKTFLQETARRMDEMRFALRGQPDFALVARHAHTLKSTSRHIGDVRVAELAGDLEDQAEQRNSRDAVATFAQLDAHWQTLRSRLR